MKLDHLVILLSDLERCLPFYDRLLPLVGFTRVDEHVFANAEDVHLDFRQASEPERGYHRHAPGLNHLALVAENLEQIEHVADAMATSGFEVPAIQAFADGNALFLRDVDGMRIEIGHYR